MGFHPLELLLIAGVALLIFGPKTLQSLAHKAGRGVNQVKDAKDKLLADLPMEDIHKISQTVSQIPLSPQQAAQKLLSSALLPDEKSVQPEKEPAEKPSKTESKDSSATK